MTPSAWEPLKLQIHSALSELIPVDLARGQGPPPAKKPRLSSAALPLPPHAANASTQGAQVVEWTVVLDVLSTHLPGLLEEALRSQVDALLHKQSALQQLPFLNATTAELKQAVESLAATVLSSHKVLADNVSAFKLSSGDRVAAVEQRGSIGTQALDALTARVLQLEKALKRSEETARLQTVSLQGKIASLESQLHKAAAVSSRRSTSADANGDAQPPLPLQTPPPSHLSTPGQGPAPRASAVPSASKPPQPSSLRPGSSPHTTPTTAPASRTAAPSHGAAIVARPEAASSMARADASRSASASGDVLPTGAQAPSSSSPQPASPKTSATMLSTMRLGPRLQELPFTNQASHDFPLECCILCRARFASRLHLLQHMSSPSHQETISQSGTHWSERKAQGVDGGWPPASCHCTICKRDFSGMAALASHAKDSARHKDALASELEKLTRGRAPSHAGGAVPAGQPTTAGLPATLPFPALDPVQLPVAGTPHPTAGRAQPSTSGPQQAPMRPSPASSQLPAQIPTAHKHVPASNLPDAPLLPPLASAAAAAAFGQPRLPNISLPSAPAGHATTLRPQPASTASPAQMQPVAAASTALPTSTSSEDPRLHPSTSIQDTRAPAPGISLLTPQAVIASAALTPPAPAVPAAAVQPAVGGLGLEGSLTDQQKGLVLQMMAEAFGLSLPGGLLPPSAPALPAPAGASGILPGGPSGTPVTPPEVPTAAAHSPSQQQPSTKTLESLRAQLLNRQKAEKKGGNSPSPM